MLAQTETVSVSPLRHTALTLNYAVSKVAYPTLTQRLHTALTSGYAVSKQTHPTLAQSFAALAQNYAAGWPAFCFDAALLGLTQFRKVSDNLDISLSREAVLLASICLQKTLRYSHRQSSAKGKRGNHRFSHTTVT